MESVQGPGKIAEIRSRQIILAGFAFVLLVIFTIILFGINRLNRLHASLEEIVAHEQVAIDMLFRMQEAARERSVLLYRIASTRDPFARDEQIMQHTHMGGEFAAARQKLGALQLDSTEAVHLGQINGYVEISRELQSRVLDELSADRFAAAQEILNNRAVPEQNKILNAIKSFIEYEIEKSYRSKQYFENQQGQTRVLMLGGGVIVALFVAMIAAFINRRMNGLISGLTASARQLQEANLRLASMSQAVNQHGIVSITDAAGTITYVNENFCKVSLYSSAELVGRNHRIINSGVHPEAFFDEMWRVISSGEIWQGEVCNRKKNGERYWVFSTIVPFLDESGLPYQYISIRTDITPIKEAEQVLIRGKQDLEKLVQQRTAELEEREELLHGITNTAQDAVLMIDGNGSITHWNPAAARMFGFSRAEIQGLEWADLIVPARFHESLRKAFDVFRNTGSGRLVGKVTEIEALRRDGTEFPVEVSIASVKIREQWHAVAIVRDITVRKLADENLKQLASTDALTGAYNRRRFNEALYHEIARAKRYLTPFTLIIFDIDHFKQINDKFGHQAGDQVLFKLALLVSGNIRNTDIFARWGGEEFVVLATQCDAQCPHGLAEKLRVLIEKYEFADVGRVTCSFGVTEFQVDDDQDSIMARADRNLYRAKEAGRNRVVFD